jgi:acyl-coenzyme A synthetase/AMP-(fatty) acid ligase
VVLKNPSQASEAKAKEIQAAVNSKLANFKHLRGGIVFLDAVPRTASGKILRRVIKADFANAKVYGESFFARPSKL